jgi:hypothetical protein
MVWHDSATVDLPERLAAVVRMKSLDILNTSCPRESQVHVLTIVSSRCSSVAAGSDVRPV